MDEIFHVSFTNTDSDGIVSTYSKLAHFKARDVKSIPTFAIRLPSLLSLFINTHARYEKKVNNNLMMKLLLSVFVHTVSRIGYIMLASLRQNSCSSMPKTIFE